MSRKDDEKLLQGQDLNKVVETLSTNPDAFTPSMKAFIRASQAAAETREKEARETAAKLAKLAEAEAARARAQGGANFAFGKLDRQERYIAELEAKLEAKHAVGQKSDQAEVRSTTRRQSRSGASPKSSGPPALLLVLLVLLVAAVGAALVLRERENQSASIQPAPPPPYVPPPAPPSPGIEPDPPGASGPGPSQPLPDEPRLEPAVQAYPNSQVRFAGERGAKVRPRPSLDTTPLVEVGARTPITVTGHVDMPDKRRWFRAALDDGRIGYVREDVALATAPAPARPTYTVAAYTPEEPLGVGVNDASVRAEPYLAAPMVRVVHSGTPVQVVGRTAVEGSTWLQVSLPQRAFLLEHELVPLRLASVKSGLVRWSQTPGQREVDQLFPEQARRSRRDVSVQLHCLMDHKAKLSSCSVEAVQPSGRAFETAALKLADYYWVEPLLADGTPSAGRWLRWTIAFATAE